MASIKELRSLVTAALTNLRPTDDFSVPFALIDKHVLLAAEKTLRDARAQDGTTYFSPDGGALTVFECITVALNQPVCTGKVVWKYKAVLPATPMSLPNDRGLWSAMIQESFTNISVHPESALGTIAALEFGPSYERPSAYRSGRNLYLSGGNRDFTRCKIMVQMAVGDIPDDAPESIRDSVQVPSPAGGEHDVVAEAARTLASHLFGTGQDLKDDGVETEKVEK